MTSNQVFDSGAPITDDSITDASIVHRATSGNGPVIVHVGHSA